MPFEFNMDSYGDSQSFVANVITSELVSMKYGNVALKLYPNKSFGKEFNPSESD